MNPLEERAWCHRCSAHTTIRENASAEMECSVCSSTFIEREGQGIEDFLSPQTSSSRTGELPRSANVNVPANTEQQSGGELIQQILGRVFNLGSDQPSLLTLMQEAAAESGRSMGFVVRQSVTPQEMAAINTMMTNRTGSITIGRGGPSLVGQTGRYRHLENLLGLGTQQTFGLGGVEPRSMDDILHHILMHETSHHGVPPATAVAIQHLPRQTISMDTDLKTVGECSITQECFEVGDVAVTLPCGHCFKQEPIEHWLGMHNTCPVCRITLPE